MVAGATLPSTHKKRGQGEGSIFKRPDTGRWVAELSLGVDSNGKRITWRAYGKTRKAVADELAQVVEKRRRGEAIGTDRQTVSEFLDGWLSGRKAALASNTFLSYEQKIRLYLKPALGSLTLAKLAPQHVQEALDAMTARGLAARTVTYTRAVLRAALEQAVKWGTVSRNAAALADPPKIGKSEARALTVDEAHKILDAAKGHYLEALFGTVMALGIREGEALGLRWVDVDLERRQLTVSGNLQRVAGELRVIEPKNATSHRVVMLPAFAVTALREHRTRQLEQRLRVGDKWVEVGLVFVSHEGKPLDRHNIAHQWRRLCKRAGIIDARFYDLRHTCASLLAAHGLSLKEVSTLLGHSTIRLTADTYTHLTPGDRAAADAIDQIFPSKREV